MELVRIEQLIEKYENAETTLQEEKMLKDFFQRTDVPEYLMEYKALFNYFDESSTEQFTKTIPLQKNRPAWKWLSVAAVALLMISIYTFNREDPEKVKAQLAYEETQRALDMISQNLNKGGAIAMSGLQEFEKTQQKIFKNE